MYSYGNQVTVLCHCDVPASWISAQWCRVRVKRSFAESKPCTSNDRSSCPLLHAKYNLGFWVVYRKKTKFITPLRSKRLQRRNGTEERQQKGKRKLNRKDRNDHATSKIAGCSTTLSGRLCEIGGLEYGWCAGGKMS